jgi:hypothetical protein
MVSQACSSKENAYGWVKGRAAKLIAKKCTTKQREGEEITVM